MGKTCCVYAFPYHKQHAGLLIGRRAFLLMKMFISMCPLEAYGDNNKACCVTKNELGLRTQEFFIYFKVLNQVSNSFTEL